MEYFSPMNLAVASRKIAESLKVRGRRCPNASIVKFTLIAGFLIVKTATFRYRAL